MHSKMEGVEELEGSSEFTNLVKRRHHADSLMEALLQPGMAFLGLLKLILPNLYSHS